MSNQEAFYSQLYQYIEKIANQVSDLRGSDTIKTGTIIQVLPGHYVVQLNEGNEQSSVKAIALNTSDLFSLQDYVYLMQATGSIENTYFIIGKVEQIQEDFLNLTLTERFTSSNELSGDLLKLNTKIEDLTILSDIKANRVFQIKGTFTCNKLNEENYGLKVSFNCGDQVIKTYNLDTNYFIGQPFEMTSQPQMRTILLDEVVLKSNFDNIIITTFGSNFTYSDITIASGSLLDVNGIVNVSLSFKNKKDYFSLSGTEVDNSVKVSAEVEYEGAPLVAPGIQYYWLLKDDSIDENSEYYFSYAGKGWKCLNTYDNVSGIGADGSSLTLQIWDSGENNIILSETGFPDFINTFKCIVKYQDIVVSSPETTIYNYNKESFFVELESNIQPPLLILETDQVILSAVVEDENEKTHMSDYTCAYQWQVENENGDWEVVTKKEVSEGVFEDTFAFNEYNAEHVLTKDWSKLTIVDQLLSDMEGDSSFYVLHGEGEEITKNFRCVVRVYRKDDLLNFVSEDFSESMQVVSKVAIAAQLVSTIYYKYYISDTPYTLFPKLENGEGDWEGDWSISIKRISEEEEEYFVSQNWTEDSNLANWSSDDLQEFPSGKVNQDAYNYIIGKFAGNSQNGSYLYITSQEVWVEERLGKINFLRKDNWTIPALAKGYSNNGNYLDDKAVDKLNTFTHLTEGGLNKGLLYDEDTGDLYINADFINTGALRVANNLGKEVLYADVDNGFVEVGGFTVDEYTLTSKNNNVGLNSNEATSSDAAIWVGQEGSEAYTKITHDGVLHAKGIIVEGNIEVKSSNTIATKKELEESSKQLSEDLDSAEKSWNKALEDQNKALLDELKVLDETTKKYINSIEQDLQNQIDGSISSWFYEGVPTLDNAPASTWKDEEKGAHLGDLYYDLKTGKCYRWAQEQNGDALEWKWVLVTDTDIALALENAAKAQATADGKITTFNGNNGTTLPPPPYQKGDLLVNMKRDSSSDAQTYICIINKKAGESPSWDDWTSIGNYATSSTLAAVEDDLQSQIDARMSIWYYNGVPTVSNDPAKNWTTVELQKQHDKDLYYDLDTGRAYRWIYSASGNKWEEVLDIRITQALADAKTAQATADGKITTYKWTGSLPDPGYQEGDLLVGAKKNDGDDAQTYLCITSTTKNDSASWNHWTPIGDYTTTTMLETMQAALQTQIDGSISVWYERGTPSLTNEPAKNWSDDEKLKHDRDLYYDIDTGYCYRWECNATSKNGKWTQIEDERIEQALADAADAQTTADGKITSFYGDRPTTGYQYGDVWMEGETEAGKGKMYTCTVKNITGQLQDWKPVGDFVTGAEVEETIKATQDEIGELINDLDARVTASTYFSTSSLTTSSGTEIPAIVMKAKDDAGNGVMYFSTADLVINSDKLKLNHNGLTYTNGYLEINTVPLKLYNANSKYNLQIDTDNFTIDENGNVTIIGQVTATSLVIDPDAAGKAGLATSSDLSEVSSVASQAQTTANNAQTVAAGAKNVANAANTTATNAQAASSLAQTAANNAAKSANDANAAAANASNSASAAEASANEANGKASEAAASASQAQGSANQAAADAANAAKDAGDAKNVADQAKGIANGAAKDADTAKSTADTAKSTADTAKSTADTAKSTADTALETANGTSQAQTLLSQTVKVLQDNVQATTYFKVDTAKDWICLKSNTENPKSPGMIFFDTNALVINSDQLKLDHDGSGYDPGHLEIHSNNFNINSDGTVSIKGTVTATDGEIGGFYIASNYLADGNKKTSMANRLVMLSSGYNDYVFWAGAQTESNNDSSRPFWIKKDGTFRATKGTFCGDLEIDNAGAGFPVKTLISSTGGNGIWMYRTDTGGLYAKSACYHYKGFTFYGDSALTGYATVAFIDTDKYSTSSNALTLAKDAPMLDFELRNINTGKYGSLSVNGFRYPYIQVGSATNTNEPTETNNDKAKWQYVEVTFPQAFPSNYHIGVIVTLEPLNTPSSAHIQHCVKDITSTGFTLGIKRSNQGGITYYYLAYARQPHS